MIQCLNERLEKGCRNAYNRCRIASKRNGATISCPPPKEYPNSQRLSSSIATVATPSTPLDPIDVVPQLLALLVQRSCVLPPDVPRVLHHRERLLASLLLVRRRVLLRVQLFVLVRPKLVAAFPTLGDRGHALFVRRLGFLLDTDNGAFGQEIVSLARVGFASGGKRGQFATGGSSTAVLGLLLSSCRSQFVNFGEIGRCQDLRGGRPRVREVS